MSSVSKQRRVAGVVDAAGVYSSRAAAADGFVFFASTAMDETGRVADEARPSPPYHASASAQSRAQARVLVAELGAALTELGSSLADICQIEQYVKLKAHADPYFTAVLDRSLLGASRPQGATAQVAGFAPDEAVVSVTGLAIVPDAANGLTKSYPDEDPTKPASGLFSRLAAAGPYALCTFFATDNKTGVHPEALAETWNWRGSEMQGEAKLGIKTLAERLAPAGADLAGTVDYTLFLADMGDLYDFDLVTREAFGDVLPTRTVVPSLGFANPRREGAFGHEENAPRMEIQLRCVRADSGVERAVVDGPGSDFGAQSAGVRVGSLLWMSSQYADVEHHGSGAGVEVDDVLRKLSTVCANGGTEIGNSLRLRAIVSSLDAAQEFYASLRRAVPADPPAVSVIVSPAELLVPGASVAVDGVAYVPTT
jgi:enamine deaminase RidA (YjgF/YER057c/UK114 family)